MLDRKCPNCDEVIMADAILCRFCDSGLSDEHFKACPFCCEMIRKKAVLCRYCKSSVSPLAELEGSAVIEIAKDSLQGQSISEEHSAIFNEIATGFKSKGTLGYLDVLRILVTTLRADRGLLWAIQKERITVISEWSLDEVQHFSSSKFSEKESTTFVLEFLSRFPDETSLGVINIEDTASEFSMGEVSPTYQALLELSGVCSHILVQIRDHERFIGILELQQKKKRSWTNSEAILLNQIAKLLAPRLKKDVG